MNMANVMIVLAALSAATLCASEVEPLVWRDFNIATTADAPRARFISHRGESMNAPENTLAAFRASIERGSDGFECDIYLTQDDEIICLHDSTAKRTAGLDVKPRDATLEELRALDAGSWKAPQFKGERIPTLTETLALAHDGFEIYVEIKSGAEIMPRLVEAMKAEPKATPKRVSFICFNSNVIAAVRQQLPDYNAYWLTGTGPRKDGMPGPTVETLITAAKACNAHGIDAQDSVDITPAFVRAVKTAGLSLHIWTVNNAPRAAALSAMGVETITSDCGATLAAILNNRQNRNPVIHWTFDKEDGATLSGAPTHAEGVRGKGLCLDGTDDFASANHQLTEQGTIALWWKPETFYNFNTVFDNDLHPDRWKMWATQDGKLHFRIANNLGDMTCDMTALGGVGQWYHLTLVWDRVGENTARLYVNGIEHAKAPVTAWITPGGALHIGGGNPGNMKGRSVVDDVRVYTVPLTEAEVKALAQK